ncbi:MAG: outer membrane beta-barrel domain-containing protein [Myxococcales bacterium]|nr:outer membrane beta-barrel domain-containing protein [Myxococcales bacterium]
MNRKTLKIVGCLAVLLTAGSAFADEGELVEKVAVRNRLYTVAGRWEVGANFGLSLLSRLTDHYNLNVSGAYNFTDWLGLELRVGYAISNYTSLARRVQEDFYSSNSQSKASDLSDTWLMKFNAIAGLRFQPIYGKINVMAELPIHFQLYGWVGGGAAMFSRESLVICPGGLVQGTGGVRPIAAACTDSLSYYNEDNFGPLVSLALGFRFFIPGVTSSGTVVGQRHSIKLEVRDWSFLDSYYVNVDRAQSSPNNPTAGGMQSPTAGITNLVMIDIGYAFLF